MIDVLLPWLGGLCGGMVLGVRLGLWMSGGKP